MASKKGTFCNELTCFSMIFIIGYTLSIYRCLPSNLRRATSTGSTMCTKFKHVLQKEFCQTTVIAFALVNALIYLQTNSFYSRSTIVCFIVAQTSTNCSIIKNVVAKHISFGLNNTEFGDKQQKMARGMWCMQMNFTIFFACLTIFFTQSSLLQSSNRRSRACVEL